METTSEVPLQDHLKTTVVLPSNPTPRWKRKFFNHLRLLKKKGFKEENMTQVGWYAIGTATTLESNKSLSCYHGATTR
jgi:hypothetical protein